ncbi:hypothetical protein CRG98_024504 [Punica granatum]|uniref:Response regulatory domain-containing protein n=1 Tax=Punica granatum TaxID=22663 RepID=A0A2I0JGT9_PUNGR|nr:hypothetical protein CRG98_024504 [Punica granatum]
MSSEESSLAKTQERSPAEFAATGLRVLLVGDNPASVEPLKNALQEICKHEVTTCTVPKDAPSLLLEKKRFDIVLIEYGTGDMDGLQILDSIQSMEKADDLPVIFLLSGGQDMDVDVLKRGVEKGVCDFFTKPIRDDTLKLIWTHVFRSRILRKEGVSVNDDVVSEVNQRDRLDSPIQSSSGHDSAAHGMSGGSSGMKRSRDSAEDQSDESNDSNKGTRTASAAAITKKPRVRWTPDLQHKFAEAIDRIDKRKNPGRRFRNDESEEQVAPKEILDELQRMGVIGLTRQNVSSHLQKHRTNKKKQVQCSELQNGPLGRLNHSSPGQYSSLPIGSSYPPAPTAPYPAPARYLPSQNFAIGQAIRQPDNYISIGQLVGPLPVCPMMTQQLTLPLNSQINPSPSFCNSSPHHVIRSAAPANLQFGPPCVFANQNQPLISSSGPHSINQSTNFSPTIDHCQFVQATTSLNEDIAEQISFDGHDDLPWFENWTGEPIENARERTLGAA